MLYRTSNPLLMVCSLLLFLLILDFKDFCLFCLFIFQNSPLCRGPFPPRVGPVLSQIQRAQILNSQVDVFLFIYCMSHLARQPYERIVFAYGDQRAIFSHYYFAWFFTRLAFFLQPSSWIIVLGILQLTEGSQPVQLLQEGCDEGCDEGSHNCEIFLV